MPMKQNLNIKKKKYSKNSKLNLGLLGIYSGNYLFYKKKLPEDAMLHYIASQINSLKL